MIGDSTEISHSNFIAFSVYNSFLGNVYVVVNFNSMSGNFCFSFVFGMVMVPMKLKQKKIKITWDKELTTTYKVSFF